MTLPLANPLRVAENAAFLDIFSAGRFVLGLGSGYRKYEFDGFGVDVRGAARHPGGSAAAAPGALPRQAHLPSRQAFPLRCGRRLRAVSACAPGAASADLPRRRHRALHRASPARMGLRPDAVELDAVRRPRPPDREIPRRSRRNAGGVARQSGARPCRYRAPRLCRGDRRRGAARQRARHPAPPRHFSSGHTSGYLGTVQEKTVGNRTGYDALAKRHHPARFARDRRRKDRRICATPPAPSSIMLHYPPWYGVEKALASLDAVRR